MPEGFEQDPRRPYPPPEGFKEHRGEWRPIVPAPAAPARLDHPLHGGNVVPPEPDRIGEIMKQLAALRADPRRDKIVPFDGIALTREEAEDVLESLEYLAEKERAQGCHKGAASIDEMVEMLRTRLAALPPPDTPKTS